MLLLIAALIVVKIESESYKEHEKPAYKDLWNMINLVGFKRGDFSYFYNLENSAKKEISLMYIFLDVLYHETECFHHCKSEKDKFLQILCSWRLYYHCLSTTNTTLDVNGCNPFFKTVCFLSVPIRRQTTTTTEESYIFHDNIPEPDTTTTDSIDHGIISDNMTSRYVTKTPLISTTEFFNTTSSIFETNVLSRYDFPWRPDILTNYEDEIPLVVFNLFMCTLPESRYLCPDICLARPDVCKGVANVHSTECISNNIWKDEINKLRDLENNTFDLNSIVYFCDCNHGYTWSFEAKECSLGGLYPNPCDAVTMFPCHEEGTISCIGDNYSGEFICKCKPQYVGVLCENIIDACLMDVVTLDGDTSDISDSMESTTKSYTNGFEMCQVNMSGSAIKASPNKCVPELGTRKFYCICYYPFLEDLDYKVSNCLKRETACFNELCVHGTCVETDNGDDSFCVCNDNYEGPMCNHKISFWSHWSECDPECGTGRTRSRERESYIATKYTQIENCPDRIGDDCPISENSGIDFSLPFTNDELKFYSFYLLSTVVGLTGLGIIMYLSQLIGTAKFVLVSRREKEKRKTKSIIAKQNFSLWKIKQLRV